MESKKRKSSYRRPVALAGALILGIAALQSDCSDDEAQAVEPKVQVDSTPKKTVTNKEFERISFGCNPPPTEDTKFMEEEELQALFAERLQSCLSEKMNKEGINGECEIVASGEVACKTKDADGFVNGSSRTYIGPICESEAKMMDQGEGLVTLDCEEVSYVALTTNDPKLAWRASQSTPLIDYYVYSGEKSLAPEEHQWKYRDDDSIAKILNDIELVDDLYSPSDEAKDHWDELSSASTLHSLGEDIDGLCQTTFDHLKAGSPMGEIANSLARNFEPVQDIFGDIGMPILQNDDHFNLDDYILEVASTKLIGSKRSVYFYVTNDASSEENGEFGFWCVVKSDLISETSKVACIMNADATILGEEEGCNFDVSLDEFTNNSEWIEGLADCDPHFAPFKRLSESGEVIED